MYMALCIEIGMLFIEDKRVQVQASVFQQKNQPKTRWNIVGLYLHSFVLDEHDPDLDA